MLPKEFDFEPSVFAVGSNYLICVCMNVEATVCVKIGDRVFFDSSNGILRSKKYLHMVEVPQKILDEHKKYTIVLREFIERKPYFPNYCEPIEYAVAFKPCVDKEEIKLCYVSDTHGRTEKPAKAAAYFGTELDALVLGGDIADHSGNIENFKTLFILAGKITGGRIPCIFTRGNHDLRGQCAEMLADYTPTDGGKSYYTVRIGSIWALVLDCGEDKDDRNDEYGYTVACHDFRLRETDFIKKVIENKACEYENDGVKYKLLMSHVPFAQRYEAPFNPEEEIYTEWCRLCREHIKPNLWLTGHRHIAKIVRRGEKDDDFGQPCECVVGSAPDFAADTFICTQIILKDKKAEIVFSDDNARVVGKETIVFESK